jgi:hypothetical protein
VQHLHIAGHAAVRSAQPHSHYQRRGLARARLRAAGGLAARLSLDLVIAAAVSFLLALAAQCVSKI